MVKVKVEKEYTDEELKEIYEEQYPKLTEKQELLISIAENTSRFVAEKTRQMAVEVGVFIEAELNRRLP